MLLVKLLPLVALVPKVLSTSSSYTQEVCTTVFAATKPAKVISTTQVETLRFLAFRKITSTPCITVTAKATTITSITTATVTSTSILTQVTDTYSSTSTVFDTTTIVSTVVLTESDTLTATVTETPSTVFISTSAGFTPIASVNPGAAKIKVRNNARGGGRKSAPVPANHPNKVTFSISDGHIGCSPARYPAKVACKEAVEIISTSTITYTARQTITKHTVAPAQTKTITATYTTTTTTMPVDASTTLTFVSTYTLTSTSISTSDTTTTVTSTITDILGPTPTAYSACAANNIISTFNGVSIDQGGFFDGTLSSMGAADAYDCCVACQAAAGCGGSLFYEGSCYLAIDGGTCDGSVVDAHFFTGTGDFPGISVSNGPCGQQLYSPDA